MQNRITWDPDEMIRLLENQLDRLKVFRFDSRYRSLLGEGFTELLARWEKDILSRRDDPFTLVICGEFKRGKSSLINALLGEDVTPVNALERANNALKEKQARFCTFKWEREKQADESQLPQMDIEKIQTLSPLQVAEHFYHDEYGTPLDDELKEMLAEVLHNLDANRQE